MKRRSNRLISLALFSLTLSAAGLLPARGAAAQAAQAAAPAEAQKPPSPEELKRLEEKQKRLQAERRRLQRLREIRRKLDTVATLIKKVNESLKLRTAGAGDFDRKRALENQLRDLITLFGQTQRALAEADRLGREVREIRRLAVKGPRNPQRLQLANFLEARQREYILFGTR